MKRILLVAFVYLVAVVFSPATDAQTSSQPTAQGGGGAAGAKALFYHEGRVVDAPSAAKKAQPASRPTSAPASQAKVRPVSAPGAADKDVAVGMHYWIELEGSGAVTADRIFRTGDRIKLHVRSNVDGYLALWTLEPSGQGSLLFPTGGVEASAPLKAGAEYTTPGYIKFQPPVQEERLLVFFSRQKSALPTPASMPSVGTEAEVVARALGPTGARALVFETEQKTPEEVGTYVVNRNGGPIVKEVRLKHDPK